MKYKCDICSYVYDTAKGDHENGVESGVDLKDLPSGWICPICGITKEEFYPLDDEKRASDGESPMALMILALTHGLWTISGRGSYSVTREIGRAFINELKNSNADLVTDESALKSVKEYFISHKFAKDMEYEIKDDEVELEIKNCRFFGLCKQLESQGVLITTCPYTNTAAMALEETTGYRYRINKEQKGYGHHITLRKVSKV
ncbi:MAG: rubredoxin [Methanobacterium sp.]|uniref:rubredoxin n=1 Tax=Methanobacterium sp. TaxID=2164 RepID=UPI003D648FDC|nr:rubredoxin [Methanobacterium sp.]